MLLYGFEVFVFICVYMWFTYSTIRMCIKVLKSANWEQVYILGAFLINS